MQHDAAETQDGQMMPGIGPDAVASARPASFEVTYGQKTGMTTVPADSFKFAGKGRISVDGQQVELTGRQRALLSKEQTHTLPLAAIVNVQRAGNVIRFDLQEPGAGKRYARFAVSSEAQARALEALLPSVKTEAFVASQAELADFHRRLDALSPHAPVTLVIVAINIIVFVAMCIGGAGLFNPDGDVAIRWGSNYGPLTMGGQWWRLLTANYIHFGIIHIALNMWALYQSGRMAERLFGSARYTLLYVFAGISGSIASLLWNPVVNGAGASGAIFGVFGGLLAFVINARNRVPQEVMVEHRNSTIGFIAYSLFYGMAHAGIDNAAHVGGLVAGFGMGLLLARPLTAEARARSGIGQWVVAMLAAALVLGVSSKPLWRPSPDVLARQQFQQTLLGFSPQESAAVAASNDLVEKVRAGRISEADWVQAVRTDVVPRWQRLHDELANEHLPADDKQFALQQAMLAYVDARLKQNTLIAESEAATVDRLGMPARVKAAREEGDAALARLNAIVSAKKP
ncbi:rhomboid family intramembrane serine protease [Dyella telluris]|uniref:Rhomboid family intramembrane serine protease n=1 Tax=Dyella telluris TaxID=2763498 RepID=A0A7G8Q9Z4_9GAMM|nr:rhomboid family intramembrane serine protease [Dyella telluris]QNK03602.1 rhomboid family intramembrane serine protease [Dyella telluris]